MSFPEIIKVLDCSWPIRCGVFFKNVFYILFFFLFSIIFNLSFLNLIFFSFFALLIFSFSLSDYIINGSILECLQSNILNLWRSIWLMLSYFFFYSFRSDILILWRSFQLLLSYFLLNGIRRDIFALRRNFGLMLCHLFLNYRKIDILTLWRSLWLSLSLKRLFCECFQIYIITLGHNFLLLNSLINRG